MDDVSNSGVDQECAVCLQKCHHPTQLPCGHVFCFLCVKGVAIQSRKCAMCRAAIPRDYMDHPVVLEKLSLSNSNNETHQWYYEGRNGWWKYDERSNDELEKAWADSATECTLLLAGTLYTIDFQTMIQSRCSDPARRRHVRRDAPTLPAKGIAGIKIFEEAKSSTEVSSSNTPVDNENLNIEVNDNNQNEALQSDQENTDVHEIVDALNVLNLEISTPENEDT